MKGTIKTLKDTGYGFIKADGMETDLFFHRNGLVGVEFDELHEGDAVTFETEETVRDGKKRTNAVNVQRA